MKNQIDPVLTDRLSRTVGTLVHGYLQQPPYPRAKVYAVLNALSAVEGWLIARAEDPDQLTQWAKRALDICIDAAQRPDRYPPHPGHSGDHQGERRRA